MKIHVLLCMVIACTFFKPTHAQIEKGKWIGSLSLNGSKSITKDYDQNNLVFNRSVSDFTVQVGLSKMLTKNWSIGLGIDYFNLRNKISQPYLAQPVNNKSKSNYLGPLIQIAYFKESLKNVYLGFSFRGSFQFYRNVLKQNFDTPGQTDLPETGNKITTNFNLLQCSYLFKKKYLISLNVANFNFSQRRLNNVATNSSDYLNDIEFSYSLNPFKNGFTYSYIF